MDLPPHPHPTPGVHLFGRSWWAGTTRLQSHAASSVCTPDRLTLRWQRWKSSVDSLLLGVQGRRTDTSGTGGEQGRNG